MLKPYALVLLTAVATAHAAEAPAFDARRLAHDVQVLASDAYEGRAVATPGETKTIAYLVAQFKAAGLQPAGDLVKGKRAWTQDVPLGRFEITGPLALSVGDGKTTQTWTQGSEIAVRAAMTGVRQVAIANAPLVFVGYGITAPERNWDDIARADPASAHSVIEAWIQRDAAAGLFRRAGLDFDAAKKQAQLRAFQPLALPGVNFSASFAVDARVIQSKNVAALRRGSAHPDQYVMYSAHWDHLGIGQPDATGHAIYNGAVDNGTGLAALLALGRAYGSHPAPQRSVLLLAVTAEEKGLLGSEYYASNPLYPLDQTVGLINMDALSPHGPARNFTISGNARLDLLDMLTAKAKARGLVYTPDPQPEAGKFFRSDHFSLAKRGVPAISFGSGNDWIEGGVAAGQGDKNRYTAVAYHQPADQFDPTWTFGGMARDVAMLYDLGLDLANSTAWPNWSADSAFRTARDVSAGKRRQCAMRLPACRYFAGRSALAARSHPACQWFSLVTHSSRRSARAFPIAPPPSDKKKLHCACRNAEKDFNEFFSAAMEDLRYFSSSSQRDSADIAACSAAASVAALASDVFSRQLRISTWEPAAHSSGFAALAANEAGICARTAPKTISGMMRMLHPFHF